MNINLLKEIYEDNKKIDHEFIDKYSSDNKLHQKNCIGFLVELGEFINETKVFKYWSVKEPDKSKVLEEYADVITSLLMFFNINNVNLEIIEHKDYEIFELLNYIYYLGTKLINKEKVEKELLSNILYLSNLLNIEEKDIYNSIKKKQKIVLDRLNDESY